MLCSSGGCTMTQSGQPLLSHLQRMGRQQWLWLWLALSSRAQSGFQRVQDMVMLPCQVHTLHQTAPVQCLLLLQMAVCRAQASSAQHKKKWHLCFCGTGAAQRLPWLCPPPSPWSAEPVLQSSSCSFTLGACAAAGPPAGAGARRSSLLASGAQLSARHSSPRRQLSMQQQSLQQTEDNVGDLPLSCSPAGSRPGAGGHRGDQGAGMRAAAGVLQLHKG